MNEFVWKTVAYGAGLLAAGVLAGCGSTTGGSGGAPTGTPETVADTDDVDAAGFTFEEDGDPAVAALEFVPDELVARTAPGAPGDEVEAAYAEVGATVRKSLPEIETAILQVEPAELTAAAATLSQNALFEAVQKNYVYTSQETPNDPRFGLQDYLDRVGAPEAWEVTTGSAEVIIAVLDTGVAPGHPELSAKLLTGWNTYDDDADTSDGMGHGTAVAGVAAALSNNATGLAGVSWQSPVLPLRVANDRGQATSHSIATAVVWAADHGARVVNISFAPLGSDKLVLRAARYVRNAGGLVFISAGNDGKESPAAANSSALFVAAVNGSDRRASFSTYGAFVDLAAPGTGIEALTPEGSYLTMNGTSFSAPIVSGTAALVWSVRPELRPVTVEGILLDTAVDLGDRGHDELYGAGRVDTAAAVEAAVEIVEEEDETAPEVRVTTPSNRASVSAVVRVKASASDDEELADVVLTVDGLPVATDTAPPFQFALSTGSLGNGSHTLVCIATDASGNTAESAAVEIRVSGSQQASDDQPTDITAPVVAIEFPEDGASVVGSVGVRARATDDTALAQVEWLVDGVRQANGKLSGREAELSFVWNAKSYAKGTHIITVRVTDQDDNQGLATLILSRK